MLKKILEKLNKIISNEKKVMKILLVFNILLMILESRYKINVNDINFTSSGLLVFNWIVEILIYIKTFFICILFFHLYVDKKERLQTTILYLVSIAIVFISTSIMQYKTNYIEYNYISILIAYFVFLIAIVYIEEEFFEKHKNVAKFFVVVTMLLLLYWIIIFEADTSSGIFVWMLLLLPFVMTQIIQKEVLLLYVFLALVIYTLVNYRKVNKLVNEVNNEEDNKVENNENVLKDSDNVSELETVDNNNKKHWKKFYNNNFIIKVSIVSLISMIIFLPLIRLANMKIVKNEDLLSNENFNNEYYKQEEIEDIRKEHRKGINDRKNQVMNYYENIIGKFDVKELEKADVGDIVVFGKEKITNKNFKEKYNDKLDDLCCIVLEKNNKKLKLMTYFAPIKKRATSDFTKNFYYNKTNFYDSEILKQLNDEFMDMLTEDEKNMIIPYESEYIDIGELKILFPTDEDIYKVSKMNKDYVKSFASFICNVNNDIDNEILSYDYSEVEGYDSDYILLPHNINDLANRNIRVYAADSKCVERVDVEMPNSFSIYYNLRFVFNVDIDK